MESKETFSFVIRTKNEADKLDSVLNAIDAQICDAEIEVIIVDSGSTDLTLSIAKKHNCKIIGIKSKNFSWGYALNVGIAAAKGTIIGVISGHCILINQMVVQNVIRDFEDNEDVHVIYGRQEGVSKDDPFEKINNIFYYPEEKILQNVTKDNRYKTVISNACAFFRKAIWEERQFDEKLQSCEDAEWAKYLLENNRKIIYDGTIGVIHSHKLNPEYLYKKTYWREYEMICQRNEQKNKIFYFTKFMIKHFLSELFLWRKKANKAKEIITWEWLIRYCIIINFAQFKAGCDVSLKKDTLAYNMLIVPKWIENVSFGRRG